MTDMLSGISQRAREGESRRAPQRMAHGAPEIATPGANAHAPSRILAVDGMRALACMMIYVYHVWQFSGSPVMALPGLRPGATGTLGVGHLIATFPAGVDMFMVLSGFCLFWPTARKPESVKTWSLWDYTKRRVRRIVPPYYASIVVMTVLPNALVLLYLALGQGAKWQALPGVGQYITHVLFIHTWFPGTWNGIQGVYWSLGLEAQFYIVFPLVLMGFRKWGIRVAWAMIALSIVYRVITGTLTAKTQWPVGFLVSITFLGRWMEFAAGMIAAWIVARRVGAGGKGLMKGMPGTAIFVVALAAYVLAMVLPPLGIPSVELLLSVSFGAMLVSLCGSTTFIRKAFEFKPVAALGFMSFSVFLLHQNIAFYISQGLEKVLHLTGGKELAVMLTVGLAAVLGISYLFFLVAEKPLLSGGKKRVVGMPVEVTVLEAGV